MTQQKTIERDDMFLAKGLHLIALYGRFALVVGLIAGISLPNVAAILKPWLPQMIVFLLFMTALRIGHKDALRGLKGLGRTARVVLAFQLALPLAAYLAANLLGLQYSPYVMAIVLVLAAPALSGGPNLAILLGANPVPAFRLLIVGTAMLPLTILPIFWLLPQLGDLASATYTALRLLAVIAMASALGLIASAVLFPTRTDHQIATMDGAMTLTLAVIVVGLMAALRPALASSPQTVLYWLALAFCLNIGLQLLTFSLLKRVGSQDECVPFSIVAGNRNVAIFLVTLSPSAAEPLLIFLGCYQVPMYLTPIIMRRIYAQT